MANTATIERRPLAGIGAALAAPFIATGRFLVHLAESGPRMRALEHLHRISDEELAAHGLTREGEIRRILGINAAI
ncbi:DUF1127 domain-containing protein [Paracoccus sp. R12_1]|uniref:DUF1127 domain-containing protein n=1 Tax=unclassified Paracoccus (in: a-proteobacteria) TaxID=2688777 RepID=UPI001ADD1BB7|nr:MULTISPECIES: DUF1127 domain-containing protein [unclassified Paracoccus (in: a-proteobacteria)]MBO9457245.1 DUF1127 domain-containing protein [Paracoccus sp. R12_2]MBO9488543.1 DUF1127 domain-containing protein [Paracoccus sp. R12_1]